jgi:CheY-like chemotaxis protein
VIEPLTNVLIVDDRLNWRKVLSYLLRDTCQVQAVATFEEARQALTDPALDIAVLDCCLQDDDPLNAEGLELLDTIRKDRPRMPVVMMTGFPHRISRQSVQSHGADAFLLKVPEGGRFDSSGFKALILQLVAKSK